jgi:hypothetical protein
MGRADFWKRGSWKVVCDVCGFFYHADDIKLRWDGVRTCLKDWNTRQPQDFVKARQDPQAEPWTRPDTYPQFVLAPSVLLDTSGDTLLDTFGDFIYTLN